MSGIEAFFNSLGKYSWRTLVGIFLASGTILFFPDRLRLRDWAQPLRGYLVGAFLLSGGVLLTYLVTTIHERLRRKDAKRIDLRIVVGDSLNTSWRSVRKLDRTENTGPHGAESERRYANVKGRFLAM